MLTSSSTMQADVEKRLDFQCVLWRFLRRLYLQGIWRTDCNLPIVASITHIYFTCGPSDHSQSTYCSTLRQDFVLYWHGKWRQARVECTIQRSQHVSMHALKRTRGFYSYSIWDVSHFVRFIRMLHCSLGFWSAHAPRRNVALC